MKYITFFKSYFEFAETLPRKHRCAFYDAILAYGFDGVEPPADSPLKGAFNLVKPTIDRSLNISKGMKRNKEASRKVLAATPSYKEKEKEKETVANATPPSPPKSESEVVEYPRIPTLEHAIEEARTKMGIPDWFVRWWYREMEFVQWRDMEGRKITGWRYTLKSQWNRANEKERSRIQAEMNAPPDENSPEAEAAKEAQRKKAIEEVQKDLARWNIK